jgi:8-oxo-dGTP pyrophosphatase MutT (NUDIX family)
LEDNPWKTLNSKIVYQNPWIRIREDQVIRPDGKPGIYGVLEKGHACGVLAVDKEERIYLVGQYRYPTEHYSWEIIEGTVEGKETTLEAMKRELEEEAGLRAKSWTTLGNEVHLSNSVTSERAYMFIARELDPFPARPEGTEKLQIRAVSFDEAMQMCERGEIRDALSIIALLLYGEIRRKNAA